MRHHGILTEAFDPTISHDFGRPVTLTDAGCRLRMVSDDYCGLLMRSREELMNMEWPALVHPDDVAEPSAKQAILLATGQPYDVRCRVRHNDGRWIPIQYRASLAERRCGTPLIQSSAALEHVTEIDAAAENKRKAAIAEYIQVLSGELAKMADRQGLTMLQHLLTMASFEAAQETQRQFPGLIASAANRVN